MIKLINTKKSYKQLSILLGLCMLASPSLAYVSRTKVIVHDNLKCSLKTDNVWIFRRLNPLITVSKERFTVGETSPIKSKVSIETYPFSTDYTLSISCEQKGADFSSVTIENTYGYLLGAWSSQLIENNFNKNITIKKTRDDVKTLLQQWREEKNTKKHVGEKQDQDINYVWEIYANHD